MNVRLQALQFEGLAAAIPTSAVLNRPVAQHGTALPCQDVASCNPTCGPTGQRGPHA